MKYYDKKFNRIIVEETLADEDFWDKQWDIPNLKEYTIKESEDSFIPVITKKFLKPDTANKILEGGCGKGAHVLALKKEGYSVIGIDYAKKTLENIHSLFPELDVRFGDVRNLDFDDNFFDGYWSLGVIEHFYGGYEKIADEMSRVIKKDGYLFLTFPTISMFRKIKIILGIYKTFNEKQFKKDNFYQFILEKKDVIEYFEKKGFELSFSSNIHGLKGIADELIPQKSQGRAKSIASGSIYKNISKIASRITSPFSGHLALLVLKKK